MVMEVNKEESQRCLALAKTFLQNKDYPKALRFFQKTQTLYPLPGVPALIKRCEDEINNSQQQQDSGPSERQREAKQRREKQESGIPPSTRAYTPEQETIVKDIIKNSKSKQDTHYKVLSISKTSSTAEIKTAYRKKSLKCHPDKNPAPDADEAFKAVGLAYSVLSDTQKKSDYDRFGDLDPAEGGSTQNPFGGMGGFRGGGNGHRGGHGGDIDPEDVFRMFFGGGGGGGGFGGGPGFRVYSNQGGTGGGGNGRRQQNTNNGGNQGGMGQLMQLLPLIILFLISFLSFPDETSSGSGQFFSLTQKSPYLIPQVTSTRGIVKDIPFYVTSQFKQRDGRDPWKLASVERQVEKSYDQYLQNECLAQKTTKRRMQQRAENFRGAREQKEKEMAKVREFKLARCDERRDLFGNKR